MSTRGCCGFVINGEEKLTYNHLDSYPSGLGCEIAKFLVETPFDEVVKIAERIVMVKENSTPTKDQIDICTQMDINKMTVIWDSLANGVYESQNPDDITAN